MSKQLLEKILKHQALDRGEVHWYTECFEMRHTLPAGARYAQDDMAVYETIPDDGHDVLCVKNATCVIVLTAENVPTVWIDQNADPVMVQGLINEFMTPAAATTSCDTGT